MGILTAKQIQQIGFKQVGLNLALSDKASFYNAKNIILGDNVRIDDFCVLSAGVGGIQIGDHIHIAVYSSLIGAGSISISDYSNISSRVSIYSSNDDYSGRYMTNPTVPKEYTNVKHADVSIGRHVIVGSGSVVLPGVVLEDGVAIGALSLVSKSCDSFWIYAGNPAQKIRERDRGLLALERKYLAENKSNLDSIDNKK